MAYQAGLPDDTEQYFLYDEATQARRQLTSDPTAIAYTGACPAQFKFDGAIMCDGVRAQR